ncbi:MAG: exopolyphosphatase / guanosine-5-triphosphate,3-diphosphate pyrophosphatase [Blastocatellia bacterium]|jgi:exopolyphosphatase/guanosine-5'-triphosphate,3'-diphosphate pyrophosphatase|nr:exopolyphosphatase / guanosine-5-triphosphate,3-diphosphate pyrophosphatase [Blastocatellia bacterium]
MKVAAIDIGSNSIKLVVVDAAASDSFAILARDKDSVRLGHTTLRRGHLSVATIERAAVCIKRFRSIAEARGAERIFAVATASVREARNAKQFIKEIDRRTGVRVSILSAIEEARLIGIAASHGCTSGGAALINIDIGGGSTEISLMRDGSPAQLFSVKLGAVGLTERYIKSDPVAPKEVRPLIEEVRAALERPGRELRGARWQLATGTSGTILAIGEALRPRSTDDERRLQGAQPAGDEIVLSKLARFNSRVAGLKLSERQALPGISAQRSEIIVAGGQILEGAMRALGINLLRTCSWALREGVLIDRLREIEAESRPPVPDIIDHRLRGVHAVGRRFGYEEAHARQVAGLAEAIFDQLAPDNATGGLTRHHRTLLSAAALLHDVGYHIAHESHHKHALYLIKNSELTGFSEAERDVIANVARYHRGSSPRERHPDYTALNEADRETVFALAAILRIADALDRSHDSRVSEVRCVRDGQLVHIQLSSSANCDHEIFAAEQKSEMFAQVFNCKVSFSRRAALKRA